MCMKSFKETRNSKIEFGRQKMVFIRKEVLQKFLVLLRHENLTRTAREPDNPITFLILYKF